MAQLWWPYPKGHMAKAFPRPPWSSLVMKEVSPSYGSFGDTEMHLLPCLYKGCGPLLMRPQGETKVKKP